MVEIKIKQNFSVEKLLKNIGVSTSILLNEIAKPIKEGWDEELKGNFQPLKKSTEKLHGSHRPLHLTGKLSKSNKIIKATPKRLKAVVKNTAKSSKNYKIKTPKGKVYKVPYEVLVLMKGTEWVDNNLVGTKHYDEKRRHAYAVWGGGRKSDFRFFFNAEPDVVGTTK